MLKTIATWACATTVATSAIACASLGARGYDGQEPWTGRMLSDHDLETVVLTESELAPTWKHTDWEKSFTDLKAAPTEGDVACGASQDYVAAHPVEDAHAARLHSFVAAPRDTDLLLEVRVYPSEEDARRVLGLVRAEESCEQLGRNTLAARPERLPLLAWGDEAVGSRHVFLVQHRAVNYRYVRVGNVVIETFDDDGEGKDRAEVERAIGQQVENIEKALGRR